MQRIMLAVLVLLLALMPTYAQATQEFDHALAYIGSDGNLYLTDGITTLQLTDDAFYSPDGSSVSYAQPRWSPDGTRLMVIRKEPLEGDALLMLENGSALEVVLKAPEFAISSTLAWAPASDGVAFVGWDGISEGLFRMMLADKTPVFLGATMSGVGEPDLEDPARELVAIEAGNQPYRVDYFMDWSEAGIVYSTPDAAGYVQQLDVEGKPLHLWDVATIILNSAGDAFVFGEGAAQRVTASGEPERFTNEAVNPGMPVAWYNDTLLFTQRVDEISVASDVTVEAGAEYFDFAWGYFSAISGTLELWSRIPDGAATRLFTAEGFAFGVVRPVSDNALALSVITSNADLVTALNSGTIPADVDALKAHPVSYVVVDGATIMSVEGGQPDYNPNPFTVVLPE